MSDVCAITGVDKVINFKDVGVGVSTRGSKLIPTLQERYHALIQEKVRSDLVKRQVEARDKARAAMGSGDNTGMLEDNGTTVSKELKVLQSDDEINAKAEMYSKVMTKKPSRKDIITLIKFNNADIMDLISNLRKEVNS